jgi:4'-phosphopantetheinyl transferase
MAIIDSKWRPFNEKGSPDRKTVDVWRGQLNKEPDALRRCKQYLSSEEISVADRFVRRSDRNRYIFAHGMLRDVLASYVGFDAKQLLLQTNKFGKPYIANPEFGKKIHFNLSHSLNIILIAVSIHSPVGIDVEFMRDMKDARQIAMRNFSRTEKDYLTSLSPDEFMNMFYQYWTLKESFIKAIGKGLSFPLDKFSVLLPDSVPPKVPIKVTKSEQVDDRWIGYLLFPGTNYSAAMTTDICIQSIRLFQYRS